MPDLDRLPPGNRQLVSAPFTRLAVAHALTVAGDTLVTVALAGSLFFDISPDAARTRVALSLALTMAPFAVVAPLIGPAIDRTTGGRRLMAVFAAAGRAVVAVLLAGELESLLLFPLAFTHLVLSKAHTVAKASLVPATVDSHQGLVEANAKLALGTGLVGFLIAGPGVAVLRLAGPEWVVRAAAAIFVVGAIAALRIPRLAAPTRAPGDGALNDVGRFGMPRSVRLAGTATAVLRFLVGFVTFLLAFALRRQDAPSWWFGVALAASVGGGFLGNLVAPHARHRLREEHILAGGLAVVSVGAFIAARVGGRGAAVLVALTVGVGAAAAKLAFDALVQRDVAERGRGRAFALTESWFQLVWVVGALLPVLAPFDFVAGYLVVGVVAAAAAGAYPMIGRRVREG